MPARFRPAHVRRRSLRAAFLFAAALAAAGVPAQESAGGGAAAPYAISYRLAMPRPSTHLFEVEIDVEGAGGEGHVDFQMPRWSPGRYAVFDFAKNVQEFRAANLCPAADAACAALPAPTVERVDTQTWRVRAPSGRGVRAAYRVFADDLSGTFSQLDERHANFNGGSVFMYVAGHKQDPVTLKIEAPRGWKIVNGQTTRAGQDEFSFPDYDVLIDTPTEVAPDWTVSEFEVGGKAYRVVVHSFGDEGGRRGDLARDVEKIVRAETAMMGAPDYERYTFLFHFDPTTARGDGMEHLNSTQIIETGPLADRATYESAVGTAAHEFFHVWNVKRLRPAELGPWDFTRPLATRSLWVAEGLTNYYGELFMRRAGLYTDSQLFDSYARAIGEIESAPGSRLMSAEEASLLAPFLDRAASDQRTNLGNTSVSYYPKGETLGIALDLLIRGRTRGRASLDDVMRRAYREFYLGSPAATYYLKGRGFTPEEFARTASEAAGVDLSDFFARHVRGTEPPPYAEALAYVGLRLVRTTAGSPYDAGITLDRRDSQPRIASLRTGSAAESAGLKNGDLLVTVGQTAATRQNWLEALNSHRPGARVPLTARRAGRTVSATVTLPAEPERFAYRIERDDDAPAEARALRDAWLSGRK